MRTPVGVIFGVCLLASTAGAREVAGVFMPDTVVADGEPLRLNGLGLHKELFFKAYVVGLYLGQPTRDAGLALTADQPKRIVLQLLRNVDRRKLDQVLTTAFSANAGDRLPALRERLERLRKVLPDARRGEILEFSYAPGVGTTIRGQGRQLTIPGKDFNDVLFSVWLGKKSVDDRLKRSLLTP